MDPLWMSPEMRCSMDAVHTSQCQINIVVYDGPTLCVRFINAWLVSGSKIKENERMSAREKQQFGQIFNTTDEFQTLFLTLDWDWLRKNCVWHRYLMISKTESPEINYAWSKRKIITTTHTRTQCQRCQMIKTARIDIFLYLCGLVCLFLCLRFEVRRKRINGFPWIK